MLGLSNPTGSQLMFQFLEAQADSLHARQKKVAGNNFKYMHFNKWTCMFEIVVGYSGSLQSDTCDTIIILAQLSCFHNASNQNSK